MATTLDVSAPPTTRRVSAGAMVVWGTWLAMAVLAGIFIARHGVNIPLQDEWETFAQLIGEKPITLSWLWAFQNEHRIPLQRVLYIAVIRAGEMDFRAGMFFNLAMLAAAAGLFMVAARRLRGRWSWIDLAFPALFLHLGQYENLLNSYQLAFVLSTVMTSALAVLFLLTDSLPGWRRFALVGLILLLLPLNGGTTLVFVPPVALWMLITMGLAWRSGKPGWWKIVAVGLLYLGLCAMVCVAYFQGFAPAARPAFSLSGLVRGMTEFAGTAWGPGCTLMSWATAGSLMLALCILTTLMLLWQAWCDPHGRARALGLLAILAGVGLMIGSVGYGRGMVAKFWGISPRYAGLLAPGLALCILLLSMHQARSLRVLAGIAVVAALVGLIPNTREGLMGGHRQDVAYNGLARDVAAGLPIDSLVIRHAHYLYVTNPAITEKCILKMQKHRIGPFARLSSPLPRYSAGLVRMPIGGTPRINDMRWDEAAGVWESTGPDPFLVYSLPEVPQIAGVRMSATISRPDGAESLGPYAEAEYFWSEDPSEHFSPLQRHMRVRTPIDAVVDQQIWIYGKVGRFRIDPDGWPCRFALRKLEMLAVPADAATNPLYQLASCTSSTQGEPPLLVQENPGRQELVFSLPTAFRLNVAGKTSLTIAAGPWRGETFRRVRLQISGSGVEVDHTFIPGQGSLQLALPPGAAEIELKFGSRQPAGTVKASITQYELK